MGNDAGGVESAWEKLLAHPRRPERQHRLPRPGCHEAHISSSADPARKSSYSANEGACVEIANTGAVRDSKNPAGATLRVDLTELLNTIKTEHLNP